MRSYKRYTRRKRLLKQIAVVALSPNRVFTKEQIYQHIYEEAESEVVLCQEKVQIKYNQFSLFM